MLAVLVVAHGATSAHAGWGDEAWGEMSWGGEVLPLLSTEGVLALGFVVALAGVWLARRVQRSLANLVDESRS